MEKEEKNSINEQDKSIEFEINNNDIKEEEEIKKENEENGSQSQRKKKEEEISGENKEEESLNIYSAGNSLDIISKEEKQEILNLVADNERRSSIEKAYSEGKQDSSNISGDIEVRPNSTNNLYYLGNLFRDVVNKFDM